MRPLLIAAVLSLPATPPAAAIADVTVHVSTAKDQSGSDGVCSLREALDYARGMTRPDCAQVAPNGVVTISVPAGCYRLSNPVAITSSAVVSRVLVAGAGAGAAACDGGGTVIDAQHTGTTFLSESSNPVELSGMTLTGGLSCTTASAGCNGGAIFNTGNLTLDGVTITGNAAAAGGDQSTPGSGLPGGDGHDGGGIYNDATGSLTMTRSLIVGNAAGSGGAGADGSGNAGADGGRGGSGGGIMNAGGAVDLVSSTIAGNTAGAGGTGGLGDAGANPATPGGNGGAGGDAGGIASTSVVGGLNSLTATNVTIAGNTAGSGGGGGQGNPAGGSGGLGIGGGIADTGEAFFVNTTIAANSANGFADGVYAPLGTLAAFGSVIADNGSGPNAENCVGSIINDGYDVTYPALIRSDCPGAVADPKLGPLGLHGGAVPTIALGTGSAAVDAEPAAGSCPTTDERGVPRPQGSACDAGAYESAPPSLANVRATATGTAAALVMADVDPHLQDATVTVRYGTSAAYGSSSQPVDAGSSSGPVHVSVPLAGLRPGTTYHVELLATNADGTACSTDSTLTTAGGGQPGGTAVTPVVTNVRQSARRWLAGRVLATIARRRSLPVGTTFSFDLNEASTVTLAFTRPLPGRLVKGRCLAPSRRNRRQSKCARIVAAGRLAFGGHAGRNRIRFYGRLSRATRLRPGHYTMAIVAINPAGLRSLPRQLTFTIAAGGKI